VADPDRISVVRIREVVALILSVPSVWARVVLVGCVLSMFEVTNSQGHLVVTYHITPVTAALSALVWLPSIISLIALSGGGVKTSGGQMTTPGVLELLRLVEPTPQREALLTVGAALETATSLSTPERVKARAIIDEVDAQLASLPSDPEDARNPDNYAHEYEALRRTLPSGADRTFLLNRLMSQVRLRVKRGDLRPISVSAFRKSQSEGERIVNLVAAQSKRDARYFGVVLDAISNPRSNYEQYEALRSMLAIVPWISAEQRERLGMDLIGVRATGKLFDDKNSTRWDLSEELLADVIPAR
jgi:hypothetical protein